MSITESTEIETSHSDNDKIVAEKPVIKKHSLNWPIPNHVVKMNRPMSIDDGRNEELAIPSPSPHNRFRHLYTRFKRRFSINRDYRTRDDDGHTGSSTQLTRYKTFSSSVEDQDDSTTEFLWPDFEKVFDSIPNSLLKALPGLDSFSVDDDDDDEMISTIDFDMDENHEQMESFKRCRRGSDFRRNALCQKLDKYQYCGQLDTFIQQIMIERLMRTWT